MFVVKLRTPSRANYEHFHVYMAYRRQTGTAVTRQTYDRAPRLTRPHTAHISRGVYSFHSGCVRLKVKCYGCGRMGYTRSAIPNPDDSLPHRLPVVGLYPRPDSSLVVRVKTDRSHHHRAITRGRRLTRFGVIGYCIPFNATTWVVTLTE